ncbi:hypothetical protein SOVF_192550, partial [Spinacia oleracea]
MFYAGKRISAKVIIVIVSPIVAVLVALLVTSTIIRYKRPKTYDVVEIDVE